MISVETIQLCSCSVKAVRPYPNAHASLCSNNILLMNIGISYNFMHQEIYLFYEFFQPLENVKNILSSRTV